MLVSGRSHNRQSSGKTKLKKSVGSFLNAANRMVGHRPGLAMTVRVG